MRYRISFVCEADTIGAVISAAGPITCLRIEDAEEAPARTVYSGTIRERTLQFLRSRRQHRWSIDEIASAVEANPNSVSAQLTGLIEEGVVVRFSKNSYGAK